MEEAKGGSLELDEAIHAAVGLAMNEVVHQGFQPNTYTTSIDAALALVAKVLPGQDFTLHSNGTRWAPGEPAGRIRCEPLTSVEETAPTLPLAIPNALLRSLLQQSEAAHVER